MLPHGVMTAIVVVWYFHTVSQTPLLHLHQNTNLAEHLLDAAVMTPIVLILYLKMLFLGHSLSVFYSWPTDPPTLSLSLGAASIAVTALLALIAMALWRKNKPFFFYFAAFFSGHGSLFGIGKGWPLDCKPLSLFFGLCDHGHVYRDLPFPTLETLSYGTMYASGLCRT